VLSKSVTRRSSRTSSPRRGANDNARLRVIRTDVPRRSGGQGAGGLSPLKPGQLGRLKRIIPLLKKSPLLIPPWLIWELLREQQYFTGAFQRPEGFTALGQWTLAASCGSGPTSTYPGPLVMDSVSAQTTPPVNTTLVTNCAQLQAFDPGNSPGQNPWVLVPGTARTAIFGWANLTYTRCREAFQYTRPSTGAYEEPWHVPDIDVAGQHVPGEVPFPVRRLLTANPMLQPINEFAPFPEAVPWKQIPEWAHPMRQVSNGPKPLKPHQLPNELAVVVEAGRPIAPLAPPRVHDRLPPGKRTKELKTKVNRAVFATYLFANAVTEGVDLVDAFYESIPQEFKPRWKDTSFIKLKPTFREKLEAIYSAIDQIDNADLFFNVAYNQMVDIFYGKLGRLQKTVSQAHGHHWGGGLNSITARAGKEGRYQLRRYNEED